MTPEFYLSMMTMHGTIMVFFVLTTAPLSGFGNYFLPIQIGARDMAFPVLNMLSFWVTFVAFVVMMAALFVTGGAPLSGWTAYAPLSALGRGSGTRAGAGADALDHQHRHILRGVAADGAELPHHHAQPARAGHVADADAADRVGVVHHRHPGAAGFSGAARRRAFCCCSTASAEPASSFPRGLVVSDQLIAHQGGSPLLWQHLFWFFGHPEVYIAILPGHGRHLAHSLHLRAQAGLRLPGDGAARFSRSGSSATSCGATTCS